MTTKTRIALVALAVLFILSTGLYISNASPVLFEKGELTVISEGKEQHFTVEIATSDAQLRQGLMNRHSLPEKTGMLFIFPPKYEAIMWMKDTYIPLDMLFVDKNGVINSIAENTVPLSTTNIYPEAPSVWVVEFPAGTAKRFGIRKGDRVSYKAGL